MSNRFEIMSIICELEKINDNLQWELASLYAKDGIFPDLEYIYNYPRAWMIARDFAIRDTRINLYNKGLISLVEFDELMKDCGILIHGDNYLKASK